MEGQVFGPKPHSSRFRYHPPGYAITKRTNYRSISHLDSMPQKTDYDVLQCQKTIVDLMIPSILPMTLINRENELKDLRAKDSDFMQHTRAD